MLLTFWWLGLKKLEMLSVGMPLALARLSSNQELSICSRSQLTGADWSDSMFSCLNTESNNSAVHWGDTSSRDFH